MKDGDPRIVEEIHVTGPDVSDDDVGTWHRCVICKYKWRPRHPAKHHERCGIGNLQGMVERHIKATAREIHRVAELYRENSGLVRRNVELGRWRRWATGLVGPISRQGSDASLRFRIEDMVGPKPSAIERGLRVQIAALEEKLAEALDRDREFDALRQEVTKR